MILIPYAITEQERSALRDLKQSLISELYCDSHTFWQCPNNKFFQIFLIFLHQKIFIFCKTSGVILSRAYFVKGIFRGHFVTRINVNCLKNTVLNESEFKQKSRAYRVNTAAEFLTWYSCTSFQHSIVYRIYIYS